MTETSLTKPDMAAETCALLADDTWFDRRMPGVGITTQVIKRALSTGRLPPARFWSSRLARHAATLLAARHTPGRCPKSADLQRLGLHEAALALTDTEMSRCAATLGLPH